MSPSSLLAEAQKNISVSTPSQHVWSSQCPHCSTPWPRDPSLHAPPLWSPPPFLSHPALLRGPCPPPNSAEPLPSPPRATHHGAGRGVCRILSHTAFRGAGSVSWDPNTWLPGGAAPCAGSERGTASDWHVPPPGTPALGGGEGGREREGGREGEKGGRGS